MMRRSDDIFLGSSAFIDVDGRASDIGIMSGR